MVTVTLEGSLLPSTRTAWRAIYPPPHGPFGVRHAVAAMKRRRAESVLPITITRACRRWWCPFSLVYAWITAVSRRPRPVSVRGRGSPCARRYARMKDSGGAIVTLRDPSRKRLKANIFWCCAGRSQD